MKPAPWSPGLSSNRTTSGVSRASGVRVTATEGSWRQILNRCGSDPAIGTYLNNTMLLKIHLSAIEYVYPPPGFGTDSTTPFT